MRLGVCLLALVACGGPSRPRDVRATARDGAVEVWWDPGSPFAVHRVLLVDLDTGAPASDPVVVRGSRAVLPGTASGVWVEAFPGGRATGLVSAGSHGGTGAAWQVFAPWDFRDGALAATFAELAPAERLAILIVNFGAGDGSRAEVRVEGTAEAAAQPAQQRSDLAAASPSLHEIVRARESALARERPAPPETMQSGAQRSFCVVPGLDFARHVRKPATLAASTANAEIYLDDEDLGEYEGPDVNNLAQAFEERVWPAIVSTFGAPTDVDGNGKVLVLLTHELGAHLNGGWLIGYFGNADLVRARDDSADCSSGGSNHAEIVYLNDPRAGAANGYAAKDLFATVYPATLAHELQHMLNFGGRCVLRGCDGPEEIWINEALSKVAEDLAGYGWNGPGGRAEGAAYLRRADGELRGYDGRSLTLWEGDPIGNYQGVHSFLRFFVDRFGTDLLTRIAAGPGGVASLEDAVGLPMPFAMAQWASALLLSNEPGAPYSFSGAAWSPLHDRLRHLDTGAPGPLLLRRDGIAAVMSGPGLGGAARITVHSREETPPYVVVARASAALPDR
jgi:hypothetical protein